MSDERLIRTSLEVGFAEGTLPQKFLRYRGKATRAIPIATEFPFEDAQFDVVMMEAKALSRTAVREAHRVLRPQGRLFFIVPQKTSKSAGYEVADVYRLVREGFNLIQVERPHWWRFGRGGRTITICAEKKNWRDYRGFIVGETPLSPFYQHP